MKMPEIFNREMKTSHLLIAVVGVGLFLLFLLGTPQGQKILNQIQVYAIPTVNAEISAFDILFEPQGGYSGAIDPTFYLWQEGQLEPISVTLTGGTATWAVSPNQTITWAAGGRGCERPPNTPGEYIYYWEKNTTRIEQKDKPLQVRLYAIAHCGAAEVKLYESFRDITGGIANVSVSAGQDLNLMLTFRVTGEYYAVRSPHICVNYHVSEVNEVRIPGLREIASVPTRLISGLDQCFDTGLGYYTDADSMLRYDVQVDAITGQYISDIDWYIIDQDMWWKDGELYFLNPIDKTDMGAGSEYGCAWNATTWAE